VGDSIEACAGVRFARCVREVDPDRIVEASAVTIAGRRPLRVVGSRGPVVMFTTDVLARGIIYAVATLEPERLQRSAADFNDYLRRAGLAQVYDLRERRGQLDRPAVERSQQFAKLLWRRAGWGSMGARPVSHRFEIVPLADPAALHAGDTLAVEVRFEGHPLAGLPFTVGYAGAASPSFTAVTNSNGRVRVPIKHGGLWHLDSVYMREAREEVVDWESFSASLTFAVRPPTN